MDKYSQMKRFKYNHLLQFYMYDFMHVNTETTKEEDYFTATNKMLQNTVKCEL